VDAGSQGSSVPANYTGLSYESSQLSHPLYFIESNRQLIELVRQLSPEGVLRIGGNTSEFTHWKPDEENTPAAGFAEPPSAGRNTAQSYTITAAAVRNLRGFLDATGWRLIYGLNLAQGTPEAAADEAAYVSKAMGDKLIAFQFGNEPDLFHHDDAKHLGWSYEEYATKWLQFEKAVRARVPDAPLAGPDVAYKMDWVEKFAAQMRGKYMLLTGHYYIGGPPANPAMNIDALLHPPKHLYDEIAVTMKTARTVGVPYRMAEGNSCYNGGKPGLSDVFASALWAGDYMLQLAQAGYAGVNLHGGGLGVYTPIASDTAGNSTARPDYYGMLMAQQFAGATMVECELQASGRNVTSYAAVRGKELLLAVFNKSSDKLTLRLENLSGWKSHRAEGHVYRLTAPAMDAKQDVKFEMTERVAGNPMAALGRGRSMTMTPYSGMLLRFG
jgi:hypothetical protein